MANKRPVVTPEMIARMARYLGCSGTHRGPKGELMPCASQEELLRISKRGEPRTKTEPPKKRRRRMRGFEPLAQRGVVSIDSLPGGGLVSGKTNPAPCWPGYEMVGMKPGKRGQMVPNCVPLDQGKKDFLYGRALPREGDPDVFDNVDSARLRARQLGCIGVARRLTPDGVAVWTPCTNVSDYRRRTGVGVQAQRDRRRTETDLIRRIRKKDVDLFGYDVDNSSFDIKAISRRLGSVVKGRKRRLRAAPFDANAEDADGDGLIQEGTTQERPVVLKKPNKPSGLDTGFLARDFNRPGQKKKKPKPKQTAEEREAELLRRQANREAREVARVAANEQARVRREEELAKRQERIAELMNPAVVTPVGKSSPIDVLQERRSRVEAKHGKITTTSQATAAMKQAFPNAKTVDLGFGKHRFSGPDEPLTPADVGFVHMMLDLSDRYPESAKSVEHLNRIIPPGSPPGAMGMASTSLYIDEKSNEAHIGYELSYPGQITNLGAQLVSGGVVQKQVKKPPHSVLDYLAHSEEPIEADTINELAGAVLAAHEFGHLWHKSSTVDEKYRDPVEVLQFYSDFLEIKREELDRRRALIRQQIIADKPNISDEDLEQESLVGTVNFYSSQKIYQKKYSDKIEDMSRDGLSMAEYRRLTTQGKELSLYGGFSPEETIAERFAALEALGFDPKTNSSIATIWDFMGKRKSADSDEENDFTYELIPYIDTSQPGMIKFVMPSCTGKFVSKPLNGN